jgi:hypothetical protein
MCENKLVIVSASHDCCKCRKMISKGSKAIRKQRRAATYHERLHAGAKGEVSWYYHIDCEAK